MKLTEIRIEDSPVHHGRVRLSANVRYRNRALPEVETYWFEVDEEFAPGFSQRGSPWLALLLPIAITFDEPLELPVPVDRQQYEGALQLMEIWEAWYPEKGLRAISINAPIENSTTHAKRSAAFFTGGVDTFYSVLTIPDLDDLILIRGFDLPLQQESVYEGVVSRMHEAALALGKELITVGVNFRQNAYQAIDIMNLSAGGNLASVALALEKRWKSAVISASLSRYSMRPSGSHPQTDVLHSTTSTSIIHYGSEETRFEKTKAIGHIPVVQKYLRVCWVDEQGGNCGRCSKCYRTMLGLQLAGVLPDIQTFQQEYVTVDEVRKIYHPRNNNRHYIEELIHVAEENDQLDMAGALLHSLDRSERINRRTHIQELRRWAERMKHSHPRLYRFLYPFRWLFKLVGERTLGNLWT